MLRTTLFTGLSLVIGFIVWIVMQSPAAKAAEAEQVMHIAKDKLAELESLEQAMMTAKDAVFVELDAAIDSISSDDLSGDLRTIEVLQRLVPKLLAEGRKVLDAHSQFRGNARAYEAALKKAIPFFRSISAKMAEHADEETFDDIAESYRVQASIYEKQANRLEVRSGTMVPALGSVEEAVHYTERSVLFLERLSESLEVLEDLVAAGTGVEEFLSQLNQFGERFKTLKTSMERLNERLEQLEDEDAIAQMEKADDSKDESVGIRKKVSRVHRTPRTESGTQPQHFVGL